MTVEIQKEEDRKADNQKRAQTSTYLVKTALKELPNVRLIFPDNTETALTFLLRLVWKKTEVKLALPDIQNALLKEAEANKNVETEEFIFIAKPLLRATTILDKLPNPASVERAIQLTKDLIDDVRKPTDTVELSTLKIFRKLLRHFKS